MGFAVNPAQNIDFARRAGGASNRQPNGAPRGGYKVVYLYTDSKSRIFLFCIIISQHYKKIYRYIHIFYLFTHQLPIHPQIPLKNTHFKIDNHQPSIIKNYLFFSQFFRKIPHLLPIPHSPHNEKPSAIHYRISTSTISTPQPKSQLTPQKRLQK